MIDAGVIVATGALAMIAWNIWRTGKALKMVREKETVPVNVQGARHIMLYKYKNLRHTLIP